MTRILNKLRADYNQVMPTELQVEHFSSSDFLKSNEKGIKVLTYLLCSVFCVCVVCVCECVCVCGVGVCVCV